MPSVSASGRPPGKEGDWLEVRGLPGQAPRRGQIVEVLGGPGHLHYRVRWDENHESIFYPSEGTSILTDDQITAPE